MAITHAWHRIITANLKFLLALAVVLFAATTQAQNTKGDKPAASPTPAKEGKGKLFGKMRSGKARPGEKRARNKKVFPQSGPYVNNPSKEPRKTPPSNPRIPGSRKVQRSPQRTEKAAAPVLSGGRIQTTKSSRGRITNVFPQRGPYVNNPSRTPKKEKPNTTRLPSAVKSTAKRPSGRDNAWTMGSATGQSTTPRSVSARSQSKNIYSQRGPYVNNPSMKARRPDASPRNQPLSQSRRLSMSKAAAQARSMGMRGTGFQTITAQFLSRGKKNVYWGKFRKKEQAITTDIAGRKLRTRNYHSPKMGLVGRDTLPFFKRGPRDVKRGPSQQLGGYRSATRTGKAWSGDISGNKIRRQAARANKEQAGKFVWPRKMSVTAKGERSGNPMQNRPLSASGKRGRTSAVPVKPPGLGGAAMAAFSNRAHGQRRMKGAGGSVSGRGWNNKNQPVPGKGAPISSMRISGFSGYGKTRRPGHGGGSISGRIWNNQNQAVTVRKGGIGTIQAAQFKGRQKLFSNGREFSPVGLNFTGYKKTGRPVKGGGSISGKTWNNQNSPLAVRQGGRGSRMAGMFQGNIKTGKPLKGGGSVSGKLWNNNNTPVSGKGAPISSMRVSGFAGNMKSRRPAKGGGSISHDQWNNKGQSTSVRKAGSGTIQAAQFKGRLKGPVAGNELSAIGLNYTGARKTKKPVKGGGSISGQMWNNRNQPIQVHTGGEGSRKGGLYQGNIKYQKKPETAGKQATFSGKIPGVIPGNEMSSVGLNYDGNYKLKKKGKIDNKPTSPLAKVFGKDKKGILPATHISRDEQMANYTLRGKRSIFSRYVQNPKAADASLKKDRHPEGLMLNIPILNQTKRSVNAGHYVHQMKQYWDYKRAPNSAKEALKMREPGRATARIGDLQVNVKMRKYNDAQMHPDARFAHSFRDNVKGERTLLMNVRLAWAKLFKKSDNQPRNLKEKHGKPRFDPGENAKGIWYK